MQSGIEQIVNRIKYDERGLAPVIVQNGQNGEVCMFAFVNSEALALTLESDEAWFWSRSRQTLWHKGATSGDRLRIIRVMTDCDNDVLLYVVELIGDAVCHTSGWDGKNRPSCFFQKL